MNICPICYKTLKQNIGYFCGSPVVYFTCTCSYDSRNIKMSFTNRTTSDRSKRYE